MYETDWTSFSHNTMISRATAVLALAGSAAAFAPMNTPALRKPVSACSCDILYKKLNRAVLLLF